MTDLIDPSSGQNSISIPCPPDQIGNFIAGLLGKNQTIRKVYHGNFSVDREYIAHIHALIVQRIEGQSVSSLVQLSFTFLYNDGSSVEFGSLQDLDSYSELRPLICVGVSYSSIFLIKFNGREFPERQQIEIDFRIANSDTETGEARTYLSDTIAGVSRKYEDLIYANKIDQSTGLVAFRINHTTRSWGSDVENLLDGAIKQLVYPKNIGKLRKFFELYREILSFGAALCFSYVWLRIFINLSNSSKADYIANLGFGNRFTPIHSDSVERKIDFLTYGELLSKAPGGAFLVAAIFGGLFVCFLLTVFFNSLLITRSPSFLIMSR